MQVDDVLDNIQPQARAGLVHRTRTVGLVKPVKNMRQVVRRDPRTRVADRERAEFALRVRAQAQPPAFIDELYRIVHEIVHRAVQVVAVAHDDQPVIQLAAHIQLFFLDLLLKGQQDLRGHGGKIHWRRVDEQLARLDLRRVQHAAHHARQAARLLGDDVQVLVPLVGGDGAVDHAVDKAADRGHRGLELVADVGDKTARQLLELVKVARHVVEGDRQLVDLVAAVVLGHAHLKIPGRELLGRRRDRLERPRHVLGQDKRDDKRHDERHQQDQHQRLRGMAHHARRRRVLRIDEHHRGKLPVVILYARAHGIARTVADHAELAHLGIAARVAHLLDDRRRHNITVHLCRRAVRRGDHLDHAVRIGHTDRDRVLLGHAADGEHIDLTDDVRIRALDQLGLLGKALHGRAQFGLLGGERVIAHLVIEHAARRRERTHDQHQMRNIIFKEETASAHRLTPWSRTYSLRPRRFSIPIYPKRPRAFHAGA